MSFFSACIPPDPNAGQADSAAEVAIDLRSAAVRRVFDFQDRRQLDSLKNYLNSPNVTLRYLAAMAFASIRDSQTVSALTPLLGDPHEQVRIAAAYSLGQIGHASAEKALISAFARHDSLSQRQQYNAVLLEALGKCGGATALKNLAAVRTYQPTDTLLLLGQCRAIYRFGLRNIVDPAATALMVRYSADEHIPEPARLMAAHYLARTKNAAIDSAQAVVVSAAFVRSKAPEVRAALAVGLGKSKTGPAFGILSKAIQNEPDWRVKCKIIGAMVNFDYDTVRSLVTPLITDPNIHVSAAAAEFFIANGKPQDGDYYWRLARDNGALPWQTQVALYRASNRWLSARTEPESKDFVNYKLREIFQNSKNPYERAAALHGLAEGGWQYRFIHDRGLADPHPAVKTAAAEALATIANRADFYSFFGEGAKGVRRELYYYFREIAGNGDAGTIAASADAFTASALNYRTLRDSARVSDLQAALGRLKMPRDVEAAQALERAIAYFLEQPAPTFSRPAYNHPIDWTVFTNPAAVSVARVKTNKGEFSIRLLADVAPGSVANFVTLAQKGFFDNKTFHRVVSDFVVQGGCPRGDGYGALDYTIRTETGPVWYDAEGYVGMASAGPDTEGTQWFVTHSPTPHLDGRYTIFGKVVQGMDIVHQLQIGDTIEKVTIGEK